MTPEECQAAIAAEENAANAAADAAKRAFTLIIPPHRAVRYRDIGEAIRFVGACGAIEDEMHRRTEAIEAEFYEQEADCGA